MGYRKRRDKLISPQGVPKMVGWPGERADSTKGYRRRMDESISPQGILEMACLGLFHQVLQKKRQVNKSPGNSCTVYMYTPTYFN